MHTAIYTLGILLYGWVNGAERFRGTNAVYTQVAITSFFFFMVCVIANRIKVLVNKGRKHETHTV